MSEDKSHKVQILIAIIGFVGVIGSAIIGNWEKIFSTEEVVNKIEENNKENLKKERIESVSFSDKKPDNLENNKTVTQKKVSLNYSENLMVIKEILKRNTDGKLNIYDIRFLLIIGSRDENYKESYQKGSARDKQGKNLEKYKFSKIEYVQNSNDNNFTSVYSLTSSGKELYSRIINELVNNINYNEELKPVLLPDNSLMYPEIKDTLNGISETERTFFIIKGNNLLALKIKNGSEREKMINKFVINSLFKKHLEGSEYVSKNKNYTNYGFTVLGKRVYLQIFEILESRLSENINTFNRF